MKAKRNKKYVPRRVTTSGGLVAIARCIARGEEAAPLRDDQLTDLGVAYWLSMKNLLTGEASEEAWSCVVCALNIAMALSEAGTGGEYEAAIRRALDGAYRAKVRSYKAGTFRLDGEAITDITEALHIHDAQMESATRAEVTEAMRLVHSRIESGHFYQMGAA